MKKVLNLEEIPETKPLMLFEAMELLKSFSKEKIFRTPEITSMHEDTLKYMNMFSLIKSASSSNSLKETLISLGMTNKEACIVGTLLPRKTDEIRAFSDTFARFEEDKLESAISAVDKAIDEQ